MSDDLEIERRAHRYVNAIKEGRTVAIDVLDEAVKSLVRRNLARARAMRGMKADLGAARNERDLWKARFEELRKAVARTAQPETWGMK